MNLATASEMKQALQSLNATDLRGIVLRLSRLKKENKELLHYMLYYAEDIPGYTQAIIEVIDKEMTQLARSTYLASKQIKMLAKNITRWVKFAANKQAELEVYLHLLTVLRQWVDYPYRSLAILALEVRWYKKCQQILPLLHADLQHDYGKVLEKLKQTIPK